MNHQAQELAETKKIIKELAANESKQKPAPMINSIIISRLIEKNNQKERGYRQKRNFPFGIAE